MKYLKDGNLWLEVLKKKTKGFYLTDEEKMLYLEVLQHFFSKEIYAGTKYGLVPKKGITLIGVVGCGKTMIFDCVKFLKPNAFKYANCQEIIKRMDDEGKNILNDYMKPYPLLLDDLGAEGSYKYEKKGSPILSELILERYSLWYKKGVNTYFTSNMDLQSLSKKYGTREGSRIKQMTKGIMHPMREDKRDPGLKVEFLEESKTQVQKPDVVLEFYRKTIMAWHKKHRHNKVDFKKYLESGEEPEMLVRHYIYRIYQRLEKSGHLRPTKEEKNELFKKVKKEQVDIIIPETKDRRMQLTKLIKGEKSFYDNEIITRCQMILVEKYLRENDSIPEII